MNGACARLIRTGDRVIVISKLIRDHMSGTFGTPDEKMRTVFRGFSAEDFPPVPDGRVAALRSEFGVEPGVSIGFVARVDVGLPPDGGTIGGLVSLEDGTARLLTVADGLPSLRVNHVVEVGERDAGLLQAEADGQLGEAGTVLLAVEALLLHGEDDPIVDDQRGGAERRGHPPRGAPQQAAHTRARCC